MQGKDIREILKIGVILCLITSVSAGILAAVNSATAPVIARNEEQKRSEAMRAVLSDATNFEQVEYSGEGSSVTAVYDAGDAGHVVLCEPKGYGGAISLVVGIDKDNAVKAIDITGQSETPGLGANCVREDFKAQFAGKKLGISVVKRDAKDNEIDAISSATITSKAVTKGVNDALEAVESFPIEGDK